MIGACRSCRSTTVIKPRGALEPIRVSCVGWAPQASYLTRLARLYRRRMDCSFTVFVHKLADRSFACHVCGCSRDVNCCILIHSFAGAMNGLMPNRARKLDPPNSKSRDACLLSGCEHELFSPCTEVTAHDCSVSSSMLVYMWAQVPPLRDSHVPSVVRTRKERE